MRLSAGSQLGPYEILTAIGAGGMGEVYRARDPRLDRVVAVKIISAQIASDPMALARFEREGRALARLSHPNIIAIHDVGQQDGQTYAVMEFVQGEPLRRRLQSGALPVRKAVEIAVQVARGLAAAHGAGIVHRDLKPENIFLSADGVVKILDFGLAQMQRAATAASESANGGLETVAATRLGTVLGTPGYMAPEQVQGLPVDHRCDIFALGAVLFEMLTGTRAFSGESWLDVMNAVVRDEPDLASMATVPPAVRRVNLRCLEKQPQDRFSSARDLGFALEAAGEVPFENTAGRKTVSAARLPARTALWTLGVVGVLGIAATAAYLSTRSSADDSQDRAAFSMRLLLVGPSGNINAAQFSPDGRMLATLVSRGSTVAAGDAPHGFSVSVCDLTRGEWRTIAASDSTADAFLAPLAWSPDGRSVLHQRFDAGAVELRAVDVASGAVRSIGHLEAVGASWSRESGILVGGRTLRVVSPESGAVQEVFPPNAAVTSRRWPSFLPDGRAFVFTQDGAHEADRGVFLGRVGSTEATRLIPIVSNAVVTRSGHLLYGDRGTILAVRLDQRLARTEGDPQPVATGLPTYLGYTWFYVSPAGTLLVPNTMESVPAELAVFDRTGKRERVLGSPDDYRQIELSPNEHRLAVEMRGQIGIAELDRGVLTPVTGKPLVSDGKPVTPDEYHDPVWKSDGRALAAAGRVGDRFADLVLVDLGTREVTTLLRGPGWWPKTWSRDTRQLLVTKTDSKGSAIWAVPVENPNSAQRLTPEGFDADQAQISPQGRWFAYASNETNTFEIYLQNLDSPGQRRRVSAAGGGQPRWRDDGRELFYLRGDGTLMAVPISTSTEPGTPVPLFKMRPDPRSTLHEYVVLAGGRRFVGIVPIPSENRTSSLACTRAGCPALVVLTNWRASIP